MRIFTKMFLVVAVTTVIAFVSNAQNVIIEDFSSYAAGDSLEVSYPATADDEPAADWYRSRRSTLQDGLSPVIVAGNLSYDNYVASGMGNSVMTDTVDGDRNSVCHFIDSTTSIKVYDDTFYVSTLVKVSDAGSYWKEVYSLETNSGGGNYARGRVFCRLNGDSLQFAVSLVATPDDDAIFPVARGINESVLLVLEYTYDPFATPDIFDEKYYTDSVRLYVNPDLTKPASENTCVVNTDVRDGFHGSRTWLGMNIRSSNATKIQYSGIVWASQWADLSDVDLPDEPGTNADLSMITVGGVDLPGFDADIVYYEYELVDSTVIPEVLGATYSPHASVYVMATATAISESTILKVIAEDLLTIKEYSVKFIAEIVKEPDTNADLSMITVGGVDLPGFDADIVYYEYELVDSTVIPEVLGTTFSSAAFVSVNDSATAVGDTTILKVTAEDMLTTKEYSVKFVSEPIDDLDTVLYSQDVIIEDFSLYAVGDSLEVAYPATIDEELTTDWYRSRKGALQDGLSPLVVAGSLSYDNYVASGYGNSVMTYTIDGDRSSVRHFIDSTTSVKVYAETFYTAVLVKVYDAGSSWEEVYSLETNSNGGNYSRGKVFCKLEGDSLLFGVSTKTTPDDDAISPVVCAVDETVLLVLEYSYDGIVDDVVSGDIYDDYRLFVNPDLSITADENINTANIDQAPGYNCLRSWIGMNIHQSSATKIQYSGIAWAEQWADLSDGEVPEEPDTNADLSMITVGGVDLVGFDSDSVSYEYELTAGADIPEVLGTTYSPNATVYVMTTATAIGDTTILKVTAEDMQTTKEYSVKFIEEIIEKPSNNAYLSMITVAGNDLGGFDSVSVYYEYELATGADIPEVLGLASSSDATVVEIATATAIGDTTILKVTAEDMQTTKEYSVKFIAETTGATDNALDAGSIYPNPSNGTFTISNNQGSNVIIYTVLGQVVYQVNDISSKQTINANLNKGVYVISVANATGTRVSRIIIE